MKVYRIFYYVLLAGALLYGLYSGSRLCFLLVFIQLFVLAAAFGLNLWTLLSFAYVQELSAKEAHKGEQVTLRLAIHNDKPFPFTHMKIRVEAPDPKDCQDLFVELPPREDKVFELPLPLPYRGEYRVGMTRVDIQDIFGLLPMHMDMRRLPYYRQCSLLVVPRLLPLELPPGAQLSARSGSSPLTAALGREELSHLRAYTPGDGLSRVHWPATVKTQTLTARQYEDPAGGSCLVYIDTRSIGEDGVAQGDRIAECALALVNAHLLQRDRVTAVSPNEDFAQPETLYTTEDLRPLLTWLALLPFDVEETPAADLSGRLRAEMPACVYVLGAEYDEELAALLGGSGIPGLYLLAELLPPGTEPLSGRIRVLSFFGQEIAEFLSRQTEGEL